MEIQVKEGGTSLNKTSSKYNNFKVLMHGTNLFTGLTVAGNIYIHPPETHIASKWPVEMTIPSLLCKIFNSSSYHASMQMYVLIIPEAMRICR